MKADYEDLEERRREIAQKYEIERIKYEKAHKES